MRVFERLLGWLVKSQPADTAGASELDWVRVSAFALVHLGAAAALLVPISGPAIALAVLLYISRMFFITAFYHRYFSHRSFKASRMVQFVMAVLGCTAGQRGPLWWASYHRLHHATADTSADPHSPSQHGALYSHTLWFLTRSTFTPRHDRVRDWLNYPELRWLERFDWAPFVALGVACFLLGEWLHGVAPGVDGWQFLLWGFFVSTVCLYHATYAVNSICHRFGRRPFDTEDDSRNNFVLALLTLGEGWHNNHHHHPSSARMGFARGEVDLSYLGIALGEKLGLFHDVKPIPEEVVAAASLQAGSS